MTDINVSNDMNKNENTQKNHLSHDVKEQVITWGELSIFFGFYIFILGSIVFILGVFFGSIGTEKFMRLFLSVMDAINVLMCLLLFKRIKAFVFSNLNVKALLIPKHYFYVLIGFLSIFFFAWIDSTWINPEGNYQNYFSEADTLFLKIGIIIFTGIIGPIKEELLFRGVLHGFLERKLTFFLGMLLSSLIFGLLHSEHIVWATCSGAVFSILMKLTCSLSIPVALHIIWNVFSFV